MYNAPTITAQGTRSGFYSSSLGIKHSFLKNKASLTLQARNLIGNTLMTSYTQGTNQYKYGSMKRESQVIMLTLSYRINNYRTKQNNHQTQDEPNGNKEQDVEGVGF